MMDDLLAGLDDCLSDYNPTPVKNKIYATPAKSPYASRSKQRPENLLSPLRSKGKRTALSPVKVGKPQTSMSPRKAKAGNTSKGKGKENQSTPTKGHGVKLMKADMDTLMEGLGDCDWDDMEAEAAETQVKAEGTSVQVSSHRDGFHCLSDALAS